MFGEANSSLLTTRQCDCELVSHAERHVTLAWHAPLVPSLDEDALPVPAGSAAPVVKPVVKLSVWKQKWGIQPSPSPLPFHHVSLEKSCFKLLPWLVLPRQSSASCICLSCHISVCCEPRHDIPTRLAYHGKKAALCENGKVVAFQKTGWGTSAANGKRKKNPKLF